MGKQIMLVNVHEDETRIALTEDNTLVGLHIQQTSRERKVGNIYRGKVVKVNPSFQAAFIDYGESRNGFLSISDVNFNLHKPKEHDATRPKIQSVLREGQPVMVQIIKEGMSNKGSAMTTFVSLAGRYLVISPHSDRSGVSRKIEDPEIRTRLKDVMSALGEGDNLGIIVRTAGIDRPVTELKKDMDVLRKDWKAIQSKFDKLKRPGQIHQEPSPIVRVLRDYFTSDVQEVWVDDAEGFQEALSYFKSTLPRYQKRLKLYVGDKSLYSAYHIEGQIEDLDSSRVPLPSGGSLIIESTEALVSVDVNSGRSNQESDIEETALRTNLEATREIARQLRLRNLGGLIVLDYIDMFQAKNRQKVEKSLAEELKGDKARTTIGTISQFGMLELSRQRIDMEISHGLRVQCPHCGGTGHIPTVNTSANNVLRKLRELAAKGKYSEIHGELPLDSANYLLNEKREALRDLELEFDVQLNLMVNPELSPGSPISLHGKIGGDREEEITVSAKPAESRGESGERVESRASAEPKESEESKEDEDSGDRKRRRRRRGKGRRDEGDHKAATGAQEGAAAEDVDGNVREVGDSPRGEDAVRKESPAREEGYSPVAASGKDEKTAGRERSPRPEKGARGRKVGEGRPADNGAAGQSNFSSSHIVTDPEAVEKLPPRLTRSAPFASKSAKMGNDIVLFDSGSALRGPSAPAETEAGKAPGKEKKAAAGKGRSSSKSPSKGKTSGKPGAKTKGSGDKAAESTSAKGKSRSTAKSGGARSPKSAKPAAKPSGKSSKAGAAARSKKPAEEAAPSA